MTEIPVIDFHVIELKEASQSLQIDRLMEALGEVGFVYLRQSSVSSRQIQRVFEQSHQLFQLPDEVKASWAWSNEHSNRGYVGIACERLDPRQPGDLKEAFNIGREWSSEILQNP
jgi:isopenicillin N synthase-like dioxygenase